jgi:HD-like signal output (HDOD) protein
MNIVDNFFEKINKLPMLPKVVQEVTMLLNDSEVDINVLSHKIDHDQALSARVLCMSNSAYFGCSRTIKSIEDAVAVIGLRNLKNLVVVAGVKNAITEIPILDLNKFWLQSLVTASVARQLGKALNLDAETVYIAALLHNIGQLPIHIIFPAAAEKINWDVQSVGALDRCALEDDMLGINHCQVGEMLAKHWNFPEVILRVVRYYADPLNPHACALAPIVYIAVQIADGLVRGEPSEHIAETLNAKIVSTLNVDQGTWVEKIDACQAFVHEAESYI